MPDLMATTRQPEAPKPRMPARAAEKRLCRIAFLAGFGMENPRLPDTDTLARQMRAYMRWVLWARPS